MKHLRCILVLLLTLAMLFSMAVPAFADKIDVTQMPGHEVLAKLPATLQRPVRPTTLEQAEGRADDRRISVRLQEEKKQEYIEKYGDWYDTQAELDEAVAEQFSGGSYPVRWILDQSKESVFQEIVALTDSLTAGKTTDTEKAKAIFDWVSQNVDYDFAAYQYYVWQEKGYGLTEEQQQRLNEVSNCFYVYAKKQAVCSGYTNLCWLMLSIAEIPAACISGNSNDRALGGSGPHAWNTVLLDGKWVFFDATWDMWDMAPNYHNTSNSIIYCNGVFQQTVYLDTLDGSFPVSYWLCPGYECPANVVIPEGCWDVMSESFKYCTTLKSITLPSTCTIIQTEAFKGCTGLESITIPANVTQVNWRAFQGCTSLKSVTFGNKSVDIWEDAFDGTPLVEDAEEFAIVSGVLVKYKGNAREVTIPSGVTAIAQGAFISNNNAKFYMRKVVIPEGVTVIGGSAFSGCRVLTDVTIPKSVKVIGDLAFNYTPWLENMDDFAIFNGILLAYQGKDVATIEHLVVPDGVTEIAARAFYKASNVRKITLPASLTKIGQWVFNHSYLEEVIFKGTQEQWDAVEIVPDGGTNWRFRNKLDPDEQATVRCTGTGKPDQPEKPAEMTFTDVPDYFMEAVSWAVEKNITNGYDAATFGSADNCNQAQILTFLWRAKGSPEPTAANPFAGLDTAQFYAKPAIWAYEQGLISGGSFDAAGACTRGNVVTYLWKLAGSPKTGAAGEFTDVPAELADAVSWAAAQGITGGYGDGLFGTNDACTRGQIAALLYRAYK